MTVPQETYFKYFTQIFLLESSDLDGKLEHVKKYALLGILKV